MDMLDKDTLARPPIWAICRKCRNCASRLCKECKRYDLFEEYVTAEQIRMAKDNGWISVKDKLPELPNSYDGENFFSNILLITIKLKDRPAFTGVGRCYKYRREEHVVWNDEIHIWPSEEFSVTHWMPLPAPPKGEV